MQTGETDNLFVILNEVIELDTEERDELANELRYSTLGNIIKATKLIQDRYRAIDLLKQLLYNYELNANERDHLQKFIEEHYWVFGEQYTLVTAAEPKFEEALRRYTKLLTGEDENKYIDDKDKNKEMDIFAVRQNIENDSINNIVIELKHPKVPLGQKQYQQIYNYMNVISKQPEFIANNATLEFYLVGNKFDTSGDIENLYENGKIHGEKSLVYKVKNFKIYIKTWSEILNEFEIKHKFIQDKLEIQREAVYVPPPHTEIAECLTDFEKFINNEGIDTPDLIKIAILHYQFESIHPFLDGNGRIGRLLIPLYIQSKGMLDKSCLYISDYIERNKDTYYDMLTRVRTHNDDWLD